VCAVIGMSLYIRLPNFVLIGRSAAELWRHIDFSRWRPRSRKFTSGLRFIDDICLKARNLPSCQIWWDILIHGWDKNYFRFLKTDGRHIEILFPIFDVRIVVIRRSSEKMTSYPFFKIAAGSHIGFELGNVRQPTKCNCRSQLDSQIWSWSDL